MDDSGNRVMLAAPPQRSALRRWILLGGLAAILFGMMIALYVYNTITAATRLHRAIAEAERLDPGWTFGELEANRRVVPDEENAILRIMPARQFLPWPKQVLALYDDLQELPPPEQLASQDLQAIHAELERVKSLVPRAREIADLTTGRYDLQYTPDFVATLLPHCDALNSLETWLWFDVMRRAQEKDLEGALRSSRAMVNAARAIGDELFAISR